MLFQVSYDRFLEEIRFEKIEETAKDKLEREEQGDNIIYYLTSFDRPKVFVLVVGKDELTDVQRLNLNRLSGPSKRIIDSTELIKINQTLEKIEQNLNKLPVK